MAELWLRLWLVTIRQRLVTIPQRLVTIPKKEMRFALSTQ